MLEIDSSAFIADGVQLYGKIQIGCSVRCGRMP